MLTVVRLVGCADAGEALSTDGRARSLLNSTSKHRRRIHRFRRIPRQKRFECTFRERTGTGVKAFGDLVDIPNEVNSNTVS
jgi:hypothetical protein